MNTLTMKEWQKYKNILAKCSQQAEDEFIEAIQSGILGGVGFGNIPRENIIRYAYALVTKYSEASSAAACMFYDALAELSGVNLEPAIPAETPDFESVAKATSFSDNVEVVKAALGRQVKQASQDTTLQNALRDGAEFAWIPSGDTCAFCIGLAANGWQTASKNAIKKVMPNIYMLIVIVLMP